MAAKILTVDIETQRAIVETFSLYKPFIHIDRVVKPSRILCFAAQWRGSDKVIFHAAWDDADGDAYDRMIRAAWELLNEADIVVTYNGDRFDLQWFNAEFERLKLGPPTPYKSFDLVKLTKQKFKQGLLSLKLDWSSRIYLGDRKVLHGGTDLWHDIRYGTRAERRAAQKIMREYCEHDTVLTGRLMERWLPWSKLNLSLYEDNDDELLHCVKCNGTDLKRDGVKFYATSGFLYQMYRCKSKSCRATSRGKRAQRSSELRPV
ncbi:Predicted exonuclease [Mycobacteroides abscessus subsp. abscessus]|uniref:ribonuclease H-like domain-containing protein n=1 Tax=Mycobacteroides abscessus TaxID=36809 RepID=UPI0009A659D7|nr:ribonuclease H-like domain-containing protein [Mycobacteroides abscessus]SKV08969.1 Predicted exonuclease [Mycobacteroides abscessus subsp. abscessus]SKY70426.1 Predicted exonuclease [Mycobacteroides abscessus subsp. abscessus]